MKPTVLLTGSSRGVGRATALALAERSARLVLLGRASAEQEETARLLEERGAEFEQFFVELGDSALLSRVAEEVSARVGTPEVLVFNAGFVERAPVEEMSLASWNAHLAVNLTAPFALTRAFLPKMRERARGRVLFVASISAHLGSRNQSAYNVSKAGVVSFMRCLAEEIRDSGVWTAAVSPGAIDTEMLRGSGYEPRMTAAEVARTLCFLALDAGPGQNGSVTELFGV